MNGVGLLMAIIVGGFAGWLAEKVMKGNMGLLMNIVLGIAGALVFNALLGFLGLRSLGGGAIAYLVSGFLGACLLIYLGRLIRK